jgi:glyoxylase I family protein
MADSIVPVLAFSHLCVGVRDMDRSLGFYRDLLGFDVVFDVELEGPSLEAVTGTRGSKGRMVGGLVGGVVVELLALGLTDAPSPGPHLGYTNMSFSVPDLDAAHRRLVEAGHQPAQAPVDIGGVRMFFVLDPDGTPIELVEFPNGEHDSAELWGRARRR